MQVTERVDAESARRIAEGLSELRARTLALRIETLDLERRLTGATCSTLRLLLAAQGEELRLEQAELTGIAQPVSGTHRAARKHERPGPAIGDGARVDERVVALLDKHEAASAVARSIARTARELGDLALHERVARLSDLHDEAAWTLAPLVLSSVVSCEVCLTKRTCALSAAATDAPLSATLGRKMDELTELRIPPRRH